MTALEDPDPHLVSVFHNSLPHSRNQVINGEPDFGDILRINPALKSVCIRAKLLGVTRDYWLAVRFKSAEEKADKAEKADDEKAADVVVLKESKGEGKKMAKTTK